MKATYTWGWQVTGMGFSALTSDYLTPGETDKMQYVDQFLSPSVSEAKCGWDRIGYCVCDHDGDFRTEFVMMFGGKDDAPNAARWINVTGDSKGAIAEAVWSLVFT